MALESVEQFPTTKRGPGRPKGAKDRIPRIVHKRTFRELYDSEVEKHGPRLVRAIIRAALRGDSRAQVDLVNRVLGKPKETVELSGPGGTPLLLQAAAPVALALMSTEELRALAALQARLGLPDLDIRPDPPQLQAPEDDPPELPAPILPSSMLLPVSSLPPPSARLNAQPAGPASETRTSAGALHGEEPTQVAITTPGEANGGQVEAGHDEPVCASSTPGGSADQDDASSAPAPDEAGPERGESGLIGATYAHPAPDGTL